MKKLFKILGGATFVVVLAFNFNPSEARENDGDGDPVWKPNRINCYSPITGEFNGYGSNCLLGLSNCVPQEC